MTVPLEVINAKLDKLATQIENINDSYVVVPAEGDVDTEGRPSPGYLGKGTYGVVRRMQRIGGGEPVAVKEMAKSKLSSVKQLQHTLVEIAVIKTLKHPGCLRLHEVLHTRSTIYLVTTLCKGELYDFIQAKRRLPPEETQIIMKQLLDVLAYLHGVGVIHRDVKPENILINPDTLLIKLIDFGLAKFVPKPVQKQAEQHPNHFPQKHDAAQLLRNPSQGCAESPMVAVTPFTCTEYYASLEAIQGMLDSATQGKTSWHTSRRNLPKVDIYGAGVVCYAMMIGCLPYLTQSMLQQKAQKPDVRLTELKQLMMAGLHFPRWAKSLPKESLDFVTRLMSHDAATRPTAQDALCHPFMLGVVTPVHPVTPGVTVMKKEPAAEGSKVIPSREVPTDLIAPPPRKKKTKKKCEGSPTTDSQPPQPTPTAAPATMLTGSSEGASTVSRESEEFIFKDPPSESPSPADRTNFKDGWGSIMRNLRQGEDSDDE